MKYIDNYSFYHKGKEYRHFSNLTFSETAFRRVTFIQSIIILAMVGGIGYEFYRNWHLALIIFIGVLTVLYFIDLLFNLFLIYRSYLTSPEIKISQEEIDQYGYYNWPSYTIFCPLYKELSVVPQFIDAMNKLDYPKEKLQIMLLFEEDDQETIHYVRSLNLPSYFEITVVPDTKPKTKPKACNYGLTKAVGEYTVIYDAEDIPDPLQLKKAVLAFRKLGSKVVCIQAKLNFYNSNQNILTRVFTAEYSLWFDLILTGLQSINAPIPLGGTSNHFRTADLHTLKGWDSFNVAEDCDLGIRLSKKGYKTAIVSSTTYEEANSNFNNWFKQRNRWIKGYMQTYLIHQRNPFQLLKTRYGLNYLIFQIIVGFKILIMFINPIFWILTIVYFAFRVHFGSFIETLFPPEVFYIGIFTLVFGNFLYLYYYILGAAKRKKWSIIPYSLFTPIYWLMMSIAAGNALISLLFMPHYWYKTKHGLHIKQ